MIKKLFIFFGWFVLLCLVLLFCINTGLWLEWKTSTILCMWLGFVIFGGLLGGAFLVLIQWVRDKKLDRFLKKIRLSRVEYILFQHWKFGAEVLKKVRKKRQSIPWYILLGDRCGKSSLMAGAGRTVLSDDSDDNCIVPTQTLRWWFFHNICFLDLSSNFFNRTPSFNRAWSKLIHWMSSISAPSGIIVALSVQDLMDKDTSTLHAKARNIRSQIEPLARKFRRQLPLYIIITECDKFPSFSLWAHQLSLSQKQQALGYYWPVPPVIDCKDPSTLESLSSTLKNGMDLVRLSLIKKDATDEDKSALLNFPETFAQLNSPLLVFIASLCEPNVYFSSSLLAGVWFTSCEHLEQNRSHRTALFTNNLITEHLPVFSSSREILQLHGRIFRKWLSILSLLVLLLAISFSACKSIPLMHHNLDRQESSTLVEFLLKNEVSYDSPLSYLLFSPVLHYQHEHIVQLLENNMAPKPLDMKQRAITYQKLFMNASAQEQRQLVLDLANTILTLQDMLDNTAIDTLMRRPLIPDTLRLVNFEASVTPEMQLVLQRKIMLGPDGSSKITILRHLLSLLINQKPDLMWLVEPLDSLPPIQISDFWQQTNAHSSISGIWTLPGEAQIIAWMDIIERAGRRDEPEPAITDFIKNLPMLRQNAWRVMLVNVARSLAVIPPHRQTQNQIISLGQEQSPAMKFAQRVVSELKDIPANNAQPWLTELRDIQSIQSLASEGSTVQSIKVADLRLRNSLHQWLAVPGISSSDGNIGVKLNSWLKWRESLKASANEALNQTSLGSSLTRGLFTQASDLKNINPLISLFSSYDKLHKTMAAQSQFIGADAVWALYKNDAETLLSNALASSGCWLNAEWQRKVMWPMRKNSKKKHYDTQQVIAEQLTSDFVLGPTKEFLTVDNFGTKVSEYQGHSLPFTTKFIMLVQHIITPEDTLDVPSRQTTQDQDRLSVIENKLSQLREQQKKIEVEPHDIDIVSEPTSIPHGAKLVPVGARLTLRCNNDSTVLDSINFAESKRFSWHAGQCKSVVLDIKFPDFEIHYSFTGPEAWPEFLAMFKQGEVVFTSDKFEDASYILEELGIKEILVRFKLTDQQSLQDSWTQWKVIEENISSLEEEKLNIISSQSPASNSLQGKLSELPEQVTDCR